MTLAHRTEQFLSWISICVSIAIVGIFVEWAASDYISPSTTMENSHIIGSTDLHPGQTIEVAYTITRFRSCSLDINRLIQRIDPGFGDQEYQIQHVVQVFKADSRPHPSSYVALIQKGTPAGEYVVFSRVRYYCNGLDWLWPRFMVTTKVPFKIVN